MYANYAKAYSHYKRRGRHRCNMQQMRQPACEYPKPRSRLQEEQYHKTEPIREVPALRTG